MIQVFKNSTKKLKKFKSLINDKYINDYKFI